MSTPPPSPPPSGSNPPSPNPTITTKPHHQSFPHVWSSGDIPHRKSSLTPPPSQQQPFENTTTTHTIVSHKSTPSSSTSHHHHHHIPTKDPITDVIALSWGERAPPGFARLRTLSQDPAHLSGRGISIYYTRSKASPEYTYPITALAIVFFSRNEPVPLGFHLAHHHQINKDAPVDLNSGTNNATRAYLCLRRGDGLPIVELCVVPTDHHSLQRAQAENWTVLDCSPSGIRCVINSRSRGGGVYIGTKSDYTDVRALYGPANDGEGLHLIPSPSSLSESSLPDHHQHQFDESSHTSTTLSSTSRILSFLVNSRHVDRSRGSSLSIEVPPQNIGGVTTGGGGSSPPGNSHVIQDEAPIGRKGSLLGDALYRAVDPVRKLIRRPTSDVVAGDHNATTAARRGSLVPPDERMAQQESDQQHSVIEPPQSWLQRARVQALRKFAMGVSVSQMDDETNLGLGTSLALDPEVVGLTMSRKDLDNLVRISINIQSDPPDGAGKAIEEMTALIREGTFAVSPRDPYPGPSWHLTPYDLCFVTVSRASDRGMDALMAKSARFVVEAVAMLRNHRQGLHPVTLHHALTIVSRALDFFTQANKMRASKGDEQVTTTTTMPPESTQVAAASDSYRRFCLTECASRFFNTLAQRAVDAQTDTGSGGSNAIETNNSSGVLSPNGKVTEAFFPNTIPTPPTEDPSQNLEAFDYVTHVTRTNIDSLPELSFALHLHLALYRLPRLSTQVGADAMRDNIFALAWLVALGSHSPCLSFTLLHEFLVQAQRVELANDMSFGYAVRRLVFPIAFDTLVRFGEEYHPEFDDAVSLLTCMWTYYRRHVKTEMAVTLSSFILPVLTDPRAPTWLRDKALDMVSVWINVERSCIVEIFLNFENDSPVPHWRLFQDLIEALACVVDSNDGPMMVTGGDGGNSGITTSNVTMVVNRERRTSSVDSGNNVMSIPPTKTAAMMVLVSCMRHLMDLSGTWSLERLSATHTDTSSPSGWGNDGSSGGAGSSIKTRRDEDQRRRELLERGFDIAKTNGIRSAINFLVAAGYVEDTSKAVAQLLRVNVSNFGESAIGDYLGEQGRTEAEKVFMMQVRDRFIRSAPKGPRGESFDESLRRFLTRSGFRVFGEAQKIERLLESFARRFVWENPGFASEDAVLVLAFSIVILNTDLHRPEIKKSKKMKKDEFVRNLRGVNEGADFSKAFLEEIYDSVARNEIQNQPNGGGGGSSPRGTALAGGSGGGSGPPSDMAGKRSSLREMPVMVAKEQFYTSGGNSTGTKKQFFDDRREHVERSLGILTMLAQSFPTYHESLNVDSFRMMFETSSTKFFDLITSVFEKRLEALDLVHAALDILEYALGITLFLPDLDSDRRAYASLLAKLVATHCENASVDDLLRGVHLQREWFKCVMEFKIQDSSSPRGESKQRGEIGEIISMLHVLVSKVGEALSTKKSMKKLAKIAARLGIPDLALDPNRVFCKQGKLKILVDGGRKDASFILFSDCLIRCSTGKYVVVHDKLPLRTLRIGVAEDDGGGTSSSTRLDFEIRSPVKTLLVLASSMEERDEWVEALENAIRNASLLSKENVQQGAQQQPMSPDVLLSKRLGDDAMVVGLSRVSSTASSVVGLARVSSTASSSGGGVMMTTSTPVVKDSVPLSSHVTDNKEVVVTATILPVGDGNDDEQVTTHDFKWAVAATKKLLMATPQPLLDTSMKLLLYGFYKQATAGDCTTSAPVVETGPARAKFHAWRAHYGLAKQDAANALISLIERIDADY